MTKRLEDAIKRLTPEQLERVAQYAERLPSLIENPAIPSPSPAKMDWVGCLKDSPWRTGLEAQTAANTLRVALLLKSMPKET